MKLIKDDFDRETLLDALDHYQDWIDDGQAEDRTEAKRLAKRRARAARMWRKVSESPAPPKVYSNFKFWLRDLPVQLIAADDIGAAVNAWARGQSPQEWMTTEYNAEPPTEPQASPSAPTERVNLSKAAARETFTGQEIDAIARRKLAAAAPHSVSVEMSFDPRGELIASNTHNEIARFETAAQAQAAITRLITDNDAQTDPQNAQPTCYACQERIDEGLQDNPYDEPVIGQCRDCSGWFCGTDFRLHIQYRQGAATPPPNETADICHPGCWDAMIGVHLWPAWRWEMDARKSLADA